MSEIRRWLETGHTRPEVLELLREARPPIPLDTATRARSRQRVAALHALPAAAGIVLWFKSVALGAVLGGTATAAILIPKWRTDSVVQTPAPQPITPARASQPRQRKATPPQEAPPTPEASSRTPASQLPAVNPTYSGVASQLPGPSAPNELAREIQLLERARQLLAVNPMLALDTLDEHRREFGSGTLVLEREFLMIETLWRLGRLEEARARATRLRQRAPGSLYERRLSQLLGDSEDPAPTPVEAPGP
jgi:hypothetical protein